MGEEVLGLMRETQNLWGEAMACVGLGVCAHRLGDHGRARALLERALTLSRRLGDKRAEGEARNNLGIVAREQGSFAEAVAQHRASRELFHELRDTWQEAGALIDLGTALAADGAFAQAGIQIRASLQLYRDLGDKRGIVACLEQLARLAATIRQGRRAARLFGAAEALRRTAALSLLPAELADHELRECEARQQLGSAAFERAWAAGGTMSWERAIAYALRPDSPLTRRQEEVARLAALGLSNREIAARLGITEGGVANNMERIRAKLNLQSRAQLALWAIEHGLLEDLGE
jgi:non-specific serine/threonine protein kinase